MNNVEIAKALERPPDCKPSSAKRLLADEFIFIISGLHLQCAASSSYMILRSMHFYNLCMPADADIVKFYGCELGAQTKYDKKDGTSIVNGAHDTSKLCELLEVP